MLKLKTISYAVTVYNEIEYIPSLINMLRTYKRDDDEIVILMDDRGSDEVWNYLLSVEDELGCLNKLTFHNDFAEWKNRLTLMCSKDYIFQIDADEIPSISLIESLPDIVNNMHEQSCDVLLVPRSNFVDGITPEYIQTQGWIQLPDGRINWPDYQWRLYKRDIQKIYWQNKVHERLVGSFSYGTMPPDERYALIHKKSFERQIKQNEFYKSL